MIKVELTKEQAYCLINSLSYDENVLQNNDFSKSDPHNAFYERIRVKILKALAKSQELA